MKIAVVVHDLKGGGVSCCLAGFTGTTFGVSKVGVFVKRIAKAFHE